MGNKTIPRPCEFRHISFHRFLQNSYNSLKKMHFFTTFLGVDILVTFVNRQKAKYPYFTTNYLISI